MSLLVVGCNHYSADLDVLERLAVAADERSKVHDHLIGLDHVSEVAVLSTCNRVEVYASVTRFHPGMAELRAWFSERADIHPQDLDELQYSYHDDRAAAHLFSVAGGLDSMVVGERQIGMQVRQAGEFARSHGSARRVLQRVFRQAVHVSRRLRSETDIATGASSMVDVGLRAVRNQLDGPLDGRRIAIVGAGKIGALTAARLDQEGVGRVDVWNRHPDKARRLASKLRVPAHADDNLDNVLAEADLVVCTTGAPQPVVDRELVAATMAKRPRRPLVFLDLAVPRNVERSCEDIDGVSIVDVADVREAVDGGVTGDVLASARRIVDDEAQQFLAWTRGSAVEPTIRALRRSAESVRQAELERLASRLSTLDDRQRDIVDALTRGIVNTLLHEPTIRLKDLAAQGGGDVHADALRDLFDLDG
ncbi:MAG: glutamyl-tRNA reductase [Nitriliruptoraceae bacterium]